MPTANAVNEILNFAIVREVESRDFYLDMAKKIKNPAMGTVFEQFAAEEEKHRVKIEEVQKDGVFKTRLEKVQDLKIADYIVEDIRGTDLNYQQALILAMRREKKAFQLYTNLSEAAVDENIKNLFAFLAQEEAKHKLMIELEYDDQVMEEN